MKKLITTLLMLFINVNIYSQIKKVENLTEADAPEFLKMEGFGYNITRSVGDNDEVCWQGNNGGEGKSAKWKNYCFYPITGDIQYVMETKIVTGDGTPNFNSWISNLPKDLKITERSSTYLVATDRKEKPTKSRYLQRDDKPYYSNYYVWREINMRIFYSEYEKLGFYTDDGNFTSFVKLDTYDLPFIIDIFLLDFTIYLKKKMLPLIRNGLTINEGFLNNMGNFYNQTINISFKSTKNSQLAIALGMNNDNVINIVVDPEKWSALSDSKRLYVIYHEMGHDLFNLNHGTGGKMMFNYVDRGVSWSQFMDERIEMFDRVIANNTSSL